MRELPDQRIEFEDLERLYLGRGDCQRPRERLWDCILDLRAAYARIDELEKAAALTQFGKQVLDGQS